MYQKAIEYYQKALAISQQIVDRKGEAVSLNNLGEAYRSLGEYQKVIAYYQQALPIFRKIGDRNSEAISLNNLGEAYSSLREYQKAIEYYQQALPIFKQIGDLNGEAKSLRNLGDAYGYLGQYYQKGGDFYQQASAIDKKIDDRNKGEVRKQTYDYSREVWLRWFRDDYVKEELRKIYDDGGSEYRKKRKDRLLDLMKVAYSSRQGAGFVTNAELEQAFREMIAIRKEFGDKIGEISDLIGIAETCAQRMHHREAIENLKIAIELARALGDVRIEYETLTTAIEPIDILKGHTSIQVYSYLIRRDSSFDWIEARLEYLDEKLNQLKLSGIAVPASRYRYYIYTQNIGENIGDIYSSRKAYLKALSTGQKFNGVKKGLRIKMKVKDEVTQRIETKTKNAFR